MKGRYHLGELKHGLWNSINVNLISTGVKVWAECGWFRIRYVTKKMREISNLLGTYCFRLHGGNKIWQGKTLYMWAVVYRKFLYE
jgi:hypothetical protein